jgi:hypothetical protein
MPRVMAGRARFPDPPDKLSCSWNEP